MKLIYPLSRDEPTALVLLDLLAAFDTSDHSTPFSSFQSSLCLELGVLFLNGSLSTLLTIISQEKLVLLCLICVNSNLVYSSRFCLGSFVVLIVHY